ncbi:MAG TPA: sulfatase [Myxococcota bacterium]|nr:sulfatase [Myxococcota bacterium]
MTSTRGWPESPWVGVLLGGAAGLYEGLRSIGPVVVWPGRAVLGLWGSVALGIVAGPLVLEALGRLVGASAATPREHWPRPSSLGRGALRLADAVAGASLVGFVLWAAAPPLPRGRALLAAAMVGALAALLRGRRAFLPPPGLAALALGPALWWVAPRVGLDGALARLQAGDGQPPPVMAASTSRPPNLLLVVLDTVRADRLTPYGAPRDTTPCLSRLAREGTLFLNAISPAPWSLPSHASILTGQFPSVHRATIEHLYLENSIPTLAERLRDRGYDTVGISANAFVGPSFGLQRGFEDLADVDDFATSSQDPLRRHLIFGALLGLLRDPEPLPDKGGGLEIRLAHHWLDRHARTATRERPFFLFVNFMEAHLPYGPDAGPRARLAPGPVRPSIAPLVTENFSYATVFQLIGPVRTLQPEDYQQLSDIYDASVATDDARLDELIQDLDRRGLLDNTVVIVTSDHGENLGDHGGLLAHVFSVHQTLVHVPLIVRHPASFPAGLRYPGLVSTVSIFATLLEEAGAKPASGWEPAVPPLPRTMAAPPLSFAVSEYGLPVEELGELVWAVPGTDVAPFAVRQRAIQDGSHKLIVRSDGTEVLYDLEKDPDEQAPLSGAEGAAAPLRGALGTWLASLPRAVDLQTGNHVEADPKTLRSLRALGYVR